MQPDVSTIKIEKTILHSDYLQRQVIVDLYLPNINISHNELSLLIINDGQNLEEMQFSQMLVELSHSEKIGPLMVVGIHADKDRKREYGIAGIPDFEGRGDRASLYTSFLLRELLPFLDTKINSSSLRQKVIAGFSLGGLSALDIAWSNPGVFDRVAVFSGSLWWRSVSQEDNQYDDDLHRIIHQRIRHGIFIPGLKFFFQCGNMDETMDRNNNGIIDSIDDTQDLIKELVKKGYETGKDIAYLEMPEGKHDLSTWAIALRTYLTHHFYS